MAERKFDHDEARRRHAAGESIRSIAADLAVSRSAVWKSLNPERKQEVAKGDAVCDDCGAPMNASSRRYSGSTRCRSCAAKATHRERKAKT